MKKLKIVFNPFTGEFDFIEVNDHHCGYEHIVSIDTIQIDERKQMVVFDGLNLEGTLELKGTLILRD